jgi:hypothetical protein
MPAVLFSLYDSWIITSKDLWIRTLVIVSKVVLCYNVHGSNSGRLLQYNKHFQTIIWWVEIVTLTWGSGGPQPPSCKLSISSCPVVLMRNIRRQESLHCISLALSQQCKSTKKKLIYLTFGLTAWKLWWSIQVQMSPTDHFSQNVVTEYKNLNQWYKNNRYRVTWVTKFVMVEPTICVSSTSCVSLLTPRTFRWLLKFIKFVSSWFKVKYTFHFHWPISSPFTPHTAGMSNRGSPEGHMGHICVVMRATHDMRPTGRMFDMPDRVCFLCS